MTPKERANIALRGGRPDRVPIVPIYDVGYIMARLNRDIRYYEIASPDERIAIVEKSLFLHEVDGIFLHPGTNDWVRQYDIEMSDECWTLIDRNSKEVRFKYLPDGVLVDCNKKDFASHNNSYAEYQKALEAKVQDKKTLLQSNRFSTLSYMSRKYRDYHFSTQVHSPVNEVIETCGFENGLILAGTDPLFFKELMSTGIGIQMPRIPLAKSMGADSIWLTSYFAGADTISPRQYGDLVFPYEYQLCEAAKEMGLFVLLWFLGDLMPVLPQILQLPIDALILEQGRKGYDIDPVKIRKIAGPRLCLFGFGNELDFCEYNRTSLRNECERQFKGAGGQGAYIAGTPIMPSNADPRAVEYYFGIVHEKGIYNGQIRNKP